jgi:MFS family permease
MFVMSMPWYCMPVLFKEISGQLGLDLAQVGVVWGIASLPCIFVAFLAGLILDRFGAVRTLGVTCLLVGLLGALRGISGGFISLTIFMILFGLVSVPLSFAAHKAAGEWFTGKQLAMANGILAAGVGAGAVLTEMTSATVLSPLLGGWRNIMFVIGAIDIVIGLFWFIVRRHPTQVGEMKAVESVPFRQALLQVLRVKPVWFLALFQLFFFGYCTGLIGYLPLYLRSINWPGIAADGALAVFSSVSVLGVVPLSLLSDRIGSRKLVLLPAAVAALAGVGLLAFVTGPAVWFCLVLAGIVQEALAAISITIVMETKGIGATYAGTALGLVSTLSGLSLFGPPVGNRLAMINTSYAFLFWAVLVVVAIVFLLFVKDTGWKKA